MAGPNRKHQRYGTAPASEERPHPFAVPLSAASIGPFCPGCSADEPRRRRYRLPVLLDALQQLQPIADL